MFRLEREGQPDLIGWVLHLTRAASVDHVSDELINVEVRSIHRKAHVLICWQSGVLQVLLSRDEDLFALIAGDLFLVVLNHMDHRCDFLPALTLGDERAQELADLWTCLCNTLELLDDAIVVKVALRLVGVDPEDHVLYGRRDAH